MRHATLKQLRCLAAVIRTGSVTAAAAELCVTPPAITAQIRALEELGGLPLLERVGERFRPTAAGEEIAATLARIESLLGGCADVLSQLRTGGSGRVAIGIVSSAKYFAPRAVAGFRRERPTVDIRMVVGNRGDIVAALGAYEVDLAIMGTPPADFQVVAEVIGDHPLVMIAAPDHPLAGRTAVSPRDLRGETFLIRESGSGTRSAFETFLSGTLAIADRRDMEMSSNETIKQAVMAGLGVAFISAHTIDAEVATGRLAVLPVAGLPIMRQWYVVSRTDKRLLPSAVAFRDFWVARGQLYLPGRATTADRTV